eukprot:UN28983
MVKTQIREVDEKLKRYREVKSTTFFAIDKMREFTKKRIAEISFVKK